MEEVKVVIVGAGPAGLATSACLNLLSIPNIVLEREDCYASLWKKRSYDRLKLHLAKQFCELPHMPYPPNAPTFIPKGDFIRYIDQYVSCFGVNPRCCRAVTSASYDETVGRWRVVTKNLSSNENEVYVASFLVVATGENSSGFIPKIPGLDSFEGECMHSSQYENGQKFSGKDVLVVGCGNSGMEIAHDLTNWGARTSVVARSPVHILTKELVLLGMTMLKVFPCNFVDSVVMGLAKFKYRDLSSYGLKRPTKGPFYLKATTGRSPVIDVGTIENIKKGEIQVLPSMTNIKGKDIHFENEKSKQFDAIVFSTGYKSTVQSWLKGGEDLFNEDGMPAKSFPHHWKGKKGLYCVGFSQRGLFGISDDAQNIAKDLNIILN